MDMLIFLNPVVFLQCICMSNHHTVYFKSIQLHLSIIPQESWAGGNTNEASVEEVKFCKPAYFSKESHYWTYTLSSFVLCE